MPTETFSIVFEIDGRKVTGQASRLADEGDRIHKSFAAAQSALAALGVGLSAIAIGNFARDATKLAIAFESSLTKINTLVGVSQAQIGDWKDELIDVSRATGQSLGALSNALFVVTSAGERGSNAMEILAQSAKASAIGLGDTADIARTVTAAMQAFKNQGLGASEAVDTLVGTVREGNLEASALAGSLGNVMGIAGELGVRFSDLGAFIATYTRLGVSASQAVTGLRAALISVSKTTEQQEKAAKKLGISFADIRRAIREDGLVEGMRQLTESTKGNFDAFTRLVPEAEAMAGVLGVVGGQAKAAAEVQENLRNSIGLTEEGFKTWARSGEASMKRLETAIEALKLKLGEALAPALEVAARRWAEWLGVLEKAADNIDKDISLEEARARAVGATTAALHDASEAIRTRLPLSDKQSDGVQRAIDVNRKLAVALANQLKEMKQFADKGILSAIRRSEELRLELGTLNREFGVLVEAQNLTAEAAKNAGEELDGLVPPRLPDQLTETQRKIRDLADELDRLKRYRDNVIESMRGGEVFFDPSANPVNLDVRADEAALDDLSDSIDGAIQDGVLAALGPEAEAFEAAEDWAERVGDALRFAVAEALVDGLRSALEGGDLSDILKGFTNLASNVFWDSLKGSIADSLKGGGNPFSGLKDAFSGKTAGGGNSAWLAALTWIGAFAALYDAANKWLDGQKIKRTVGVLEFAVNQTRATGLVFSGMDSVNHQVRAGYMAMLNTVKDIERLTGGIIETLPKIEINVKGTGKVFAHVAGLIVGEFESLEEAISAALAVALRKSTLTGASDAFLAVLANSSASSVEELIEELKVAAKIEALNFGEAIASIRQMFAELGPLVDEARRLKIPENLIAGAIDNVFNQLVSSWAGADLAPTFVDVDQALAELRDRLESMGVPAQRLSRYLEDARFALDIFNENLRLDILQRVADVWSKIPGQAEEAAKLQAKIDQARFQVELAILEVQLKSFGLWEDFADVMRKARNFAEDINNFLPEDLRSGSNKGNGETFKVGDSSGFGIGIGETTTAIEEGNQSFEDFSTQALLIEQQQLEAMTSGFESLDTTSGDLLIEGAIKQQTNDLMLGFQSLDRRLAENQARNDAGFARVSGSLEARPRQREPVVV